MSNFFKLLQLMLLSIFVATYGTFAFSSRADESSQRQYVYTMSNSASGNSVVGYRVEANGKLNPLRGSPFSTRGLGQGNTLLVSSDSGLAVSEDNRFLFAPNRGSNDIAVFRIRPNGTLASVPGSPFPTGGVTPTSLTLSNNMLFVAHTGLGLFANCNDCDYRGFRVSQSGQLTPLEGGIIKLSETPPSGPFAIRFSPDGQFLVGTEIASSKINVYKVDHNEQPGVAVLTPVPGSPFGNNDKLPLGFNFNPNNPTQLFISNVGQAPGTGSVSPYLMASSGQIAPIEQPVASNQFATCWINLTQDGKWLFASNTNSDSVSSYGVTPDGRLNLVSNTPIPRDGVPAATVISPVDMAITTGDEYLYVVTRIVPAIVGFKIGAEGKLTPIDNAKINIPDAAPFGIVTVDLTRPPVRRNFYSDK